MPRVEPLMDDSRPDEDHTANASSCEVGARTGKGGSGARCGTSTVCAANFASGSSTASCSSSRVWGCASSPDDSLMRSSAAPRSCRLTTWAFLTQAPEAPRQLQQAAMCYQVCSALAVVVLFMADSASPSDVTTRYYWRLEFAMTVIWSIEYMLRLWSCLEEAEPNAEDSVVSPCASRFRKAMKPLALLDLVCLASLVADLSIQSNQLRGFAVIRMMRFTTLYRLERDFNFFAPVISVVWEKRKLLIGSLGLAGLVLLFASVLMFYIEASANPAFQSVASSMWWCTAALTTVGYGDVVPVTTLGRSVGAVVAFLGVAMFGLPAGIIASGFQEHWDEPRIDGGATARLEALLEQHQAQVMARLDSLQGDVNQLRSELRRVSDGS